MCILIGIYMVLCSPGKAPEANPHGREVGAPDTAAVWRDPLWGLGEIDILAQSAVNSSNFRACLGSPARNLRFPLYDIMFYAFVI